MASPVKAKKKVNWLLVILIAFAATLIFSVVAAFIYYKTSFSFYENKKEGLIIPYPKGWTVVERPLNVKDTIVAFVAPTENAMDTTHENIVVTTVDQSKNPLSIDDFGALTVKQTTLVFSGCKVMSTGPTTISGRRGYRTVFYYSGEKNMVMDVFQFMFRDVVGYNVMYFGDVETYEKKYKLMYYILGHMIKILF
jgi:hypothetical protein